MNFHHNIVVSQLVINYLNEVISKRQVNDNILFNIVLEKTSALQALFQKQDSNIQEYNSCYQELNEANENYFRQFFETKDLSCTVSSLEVYLAHLHIDLSLSQ